MGKEGPIPKKKALKVLSGKLPLKKEHLQELHVEDFAPPELPEYLTPDEKEVWLRTVELLRPLRILEKIDGAVLCAYCCSYVRWQKAEKEIRKESSKSAKAGLVSLGANGGYVINPLVNISRRCQADMVAYAAQLGMTPAARMRVQMDKPKPADNPFERLKNEKRMGTDSKKLCQISDAEGE
jgi:P27 family predicted phage terminase small subunit